MIFSQRYIRVCRCVPRFVNGVCEYRYDQCKLKESVFVALHAVSIVQLIT